VWIPENARRSQFHSSRGGRVTHVHRDRIMPVVQHMVVVKFKPEVSLPRLMREFPVLSDD